MSHPMSHALPFVERRAQPRPDRHSVSSAAADNQVFTYLGASVTQVTKDMRLRAYIDLGFGIYTCPKLALARITLSILDEDQARIRSILEGKSVTLITKRIGETSCYEAEVLLTLPTATVNVSDYLVQNDLGWYHR